MKNVKKITFIFIIFFLTLLCIYISFSITQKIFNKKDSIYKSNKVVENLIINEANTTEQPEISDIIEFDNGIRVKGIVNSRISTNLNVTLYIEANYCIKSIQYGEQIFTNIEKENDNWLKIDLDLTANFNDTISLKINMASSNIYDVEIPLKKLKIPNKAPSTPTIEHWPLTSSIKKGRNVILKAKESFDEDGDNITYIWEGRNAETSVYDIGTHTVKVKAVDEWGAESEWATYTFSVINVEAATLTYSCTNNHFNIWGNGNQTTYGNSGYSVVFKPSTSNVNLNIAIEPIYDGNYIKIKYIVHNSSDVIATYGIATHADIMINSNDRAPIYNIEGDKGFIMTDGTYYYNVYLANTENITNVNSYWYGLYSNRTNNLWNNGPRTDLVGVDSGMAFSWQDKSINPGEIQELFIIIGLE